VSTFTRRAVDVILDVLVISALGVMVLVSVANIFCRKVLNTSLVFTTELSLTLFIWMTFLGAIKLAQTNQHLRVTFLVDALGPRAKRWAGIAVDAAVLFYCVAAIMTAGPVLRSASLMRLSAVPWNAGALFWALPVGFGGIALCVVWRILQRLSGQTVDVRVINPVE
jgi:TRAP-type C4-dicarboxylate transport system permease small subunit